jgi:hypothetical protein
MKRRDFITLLGATAWPLAARAQPIPVIWVVTGGGADAEARATAAFRKGFERNGRRPRI